MTTVSDMKCIDVKKAFRKKFNNEEFVTDKTGVRMIELIGISFEADKETIFGHMNRDYVEREIEWYRSESRNVNDIPGRIPLIWKQISTPEGLINSNYGWCIWSKENHEQYKSVLNELKSNPDSRRTSMIYQRPSMHNDATKDGMNDFICTYGVDYLLRDDQLHAVVHMRSNDVIFGYKNDRAWQQYIQTLLAIDLGVEVGSLIWNISSLHIYERHFHLMWE